MNTTYCSCVTVAYLMSLFAKLKKEYSCYFKLNSVILSVFNLFHRNHGGIILSNDLMHHPKNILCLTRYKHVFPPATFRDVNTKRLAQERWSCQSAVPPAQGGFFLGRATLWCTGSPRFVGQALFPTGIMVSIKDVSFREV